MFSLLLPLQLIPETHSPSAGFARRNTHLPAALTQRQRQDSVLGAPAERGVDGSREMTPLTDLGLACWKLRAHLLYRTAVLLQRGKAVLPGLGVNCPCGKSELSHKEMYICL